MFFSSKMQCCVYPIILSLSLVKDVRADWPPSTESSVQLVGLFQDSVDRSVPSITSIQCQAMSKAAMLLAETYNITVDGQPIGWRVAQTDDEVITALGPTCSTVSTKNVIGIVGSGLCREIRFISQVARRIGIPVVAYDASDFFGRQTHPNFYRTGPSGVSAVLAIVKLFQRYNWTSCILIYQDDAFGSAGPRVIGDAFKANDLEIKETIVFDGTTWPVQSNLADSLLKSATRVVVLWADSIFTSTIVREAANNNLLGPRFIWILKESIPVDDFTLPMIEASIGMLSVEPVSADVVGAPFNASLLNAAYDMWKRYEPESFPGEKNVNSHALFAFDATWLLIRSLQQLCSYKCLPCGNSSSCFDHQQISMTKFLGVSGPLEYRANGADRIGGIHYVVRNAQPTAEGVKFVKVLKYSEPGEWKTFHPTQKVLWPGESFTMPRDRANISAVHLRIGIIESVPFTMMEYSQNKSQFIGYVPDLIDLLQKRMKFSYEIVLVPTNRSYAGMVKRVANGEYDLIVGDVTVTSARRELVAFSTSIFDNSLRLIIRKPTPDQVELFSFLKPFSLTLWVMILSALLITSLLIFLVERHENKALRDRSTVSIGAMSVWYSLGNIMGYGADFHVTTISGRILTMALYILSLVLVASYTANLASNLTISKTKYIISGIEDIKQGKLPYNRIGIRVRTRAEEYFLRQISEGSRNYYPLFSRQELIDALQNGSIDASILDNGVADYLTNSMYCNLTLVGPSFDASTFGIAFRKDWHYIQDFDVNLLALRESGDLDSLRKRWFEANCCQEAAEVSNAMGVDSMAGLFVTVGIIIIVALFALAYRKRTVVKNRVQSFSSRQYDVGRETVAKIRPSHGSFVETIESK